MYLIYDAMTNTPLAYRKTFDGAYELVASNKFPHAMKDIEEVDDSCKWFAGCESPATEYTPHPILGNVPTCKKCHEFATS